MLFSTHINQMGVSPFNSNGPTRGQRKTLTRVRIELTHDLVAQSVEQR